MNALVSAAALTFRDPAAAVAWLRGLRLNAGQAVAAAAAIAALSTLFGRLTLAFAPPGAAAGPFIVLMVYPLAVAGVQLAVLLFMAWLMAVAGRAFGGNGTFTDCLLVLVWIETILLGLQLAQVVLALAVPATAGPVALLAFVALAYLAVRLTGAVHGFRNPLLVAFGMVGTMMLIGSGLSLLLGMLGLLPEVPAP